MALIPYFNLLMGSCNGIATYKQKPIDNMLLAGYASIITPITMIKVYSNTPWETKIRYNGIPMFVGSLIATSAINGAVFGLGHIIGKSSYSVLNS